MTFKISQPNENRQIFVEIGNLNKISKEAIKRAFFTFGNDLVRETRRLITEPPKTGRIYRIRRRGRIVNHRASAPGEAPANLSGRLRRSTNFKVRGSLQMEIGENTPYAGFLELGTKKMAARPHLIKAINKKRENLQLHFQREMNRMLK